MGLLELIVILLVLAFIGWPPFAFDLAKILVVVFLVFWLLGRGLYLGSDFVHFLLVLMIVVVILKYLKKI